MHHHSIYVSPTKKESTIPAKYISSHHSLTVSAKYIKFHQNTTNNVISFQFECSGWCWAFTPMDIASLMSAPATVSGVAGSPCLAPYEDQIWGGGERL